MFHDLAPLFKSQSCKIYLKNRKKDTFSFDSTYICIYGHSHYVGTHFVNIMSKPFFCLNVIVLCICLSLGCSRQEKKIKTKIKIDKKFGVCNRKMLGGNLTNCSNKPDIKMFQLKYMYIERLKVCTYFINKLLNNGEFK